jgi:Zn-dependent peptidase ImmA (M78 family)
MVRRRHIRLLVNRLLNDHQIRFAPVPVAVLAKALGAEVQYQPAEDDLSGFLYCDRQRKTAIIGVNSGHHPNRQNFTAAHELGHFLLHDFDTVHVDRQFKVWLRSETSSQGTDPEEKEANLFAAELLMPAKFLEKDIEEVGTFDLFNEAIIQDLAARYGVSPQAMTFRLAYLGYEQQ